MVALVGKHYYAVFQILLVITLLTLLKVCTNNHDAVVLLLTVLLYVLCLFYCRWGIMTRWWRSWAPPSTPVSSCLSGPCVTSASLWYLYAYVRV